MATKKKKKSRKGRGGKVAVKRTGRKPVYKPQYAERIRTLVLDCGMVNTKGQIAWANIAKVWGLSTETLRLWRDASRADYYKPDFAAAVAKVKEDVDSGKVKQSAIVQAAKHTLYRGTSVLKSVGPKPPRSSYTKGLLLRYAAEVLGLDLAPKLTKGQIQYEIDRALEAQTAEKMVEVRRDRCEVDPNPDARRLILNNLGTDKWDTKERIETTDIRSIEVHYELAEDEKDSGENPDTSGGGGSGDGDDA